MSEPEHRGPGRPRKTPAVAPEPPAAEDEDTTLEALEALDPETLVDRALEHRVPLTPVVVKALNDTWRDTVQYDDEESKRRTRMIAGVLRRASHRELHPNCTRVTIDVPMLPNKVYVRINERAYFGSVEVWECESRTILELVHRARMVEAQRNTDRPDALVDLDSPLAERARAIQRA